MYKYKISTVRTSTSVEFYQATDTVRSHINDVYVNPGIMTITDETTDELVSIIIYQFTSEEDWIRFKADPIIAQHIQNRKTYESENEIFRWKEIL